MGKTRRVAWHLPYIEAGTAIVHGRIMENFRLPFYKDLYFETLVLPGFSDTHAHPQVVDAGLKPGNLGKWRDSYHWLNTRRLHVDEALVRMDKELSSKLAELALKRMALEGVTLAAFTGNLEANLLARMRFSPGPRLVLLPTIMDRKGWSQPQDVSRLYAKYGNFIEDGFLHAGIFIHSLGLASKNTINGAIRLALKGRLPVGLHLSEGAREGQYFKRILKNYKRIPRLIAVHCISDDPRPLGVRCSSCPSTNLILYGRTRLSLRGVTSFGSDWPHLIGSMPRHLGLITRLFPASLREILYRATTGGYIDYGVSYRGDLIAYNSKIDEVLSGKSTPTFVTVEGEVIVDDKRIVSTGESLKDIEKDSLEVIKYSVETYGDSIMPYIPGPSIVWELMSRLDADSSIGLARELLLNNSGNDI